MSCYPTSGISSHLGTKLRDLAIWHIGADCYSLSSNDLETIYLLRCPAKEVPLRNFIRIVLRAKYSGLAFRWKVRSIIPSSTSAPPICNEWLRWNMRSVCCCCRRMMALSDGMSRHLGLETLIQTFWIWFLPEKYHPQIVTAFQWPLSPRKTKMPIINRNFSHTLNSWTSRSWEVAVRIQGATFRKGRGRGCLDF